MRRWRKIAGLFLLLLLTFAAGYFAARITSASGLTLRASEYSVHPAAAPIVPSEQVSEEPSPTPVPELEEMPVDKADIEPDAVALPQFYTYDKEPQIGDNYTVPAE